MSHTERRLQRKEATSDLGFIGRGLGRLRGLALLLLALLFLLLCLFLRLFGGLFRLLLAVGFGENGLGMRLSRRMWNGNIAGITRRAGKSRSEGERKGPSSLGPRSSAFWS